MKSFQPTSIRSSENLTADPGKSIGGSVIPSGKPPMLTSHDLQHGKYKELTGNRFTSVSGKKGK